MKLGVWVLVGMALSLAVFLLVFLEISEESVGAQVVGDPVLVGAGDIATCSSSGDEATARLLDGIPGTVFTLGDNVYPDGTAALFADCYEPSWGRHEARTMPSLGNHEYHAAGASGYFDYFGASAGNPAKGYYSYDRGDWHIVVLNSNCSEVAGGCKAGSPQEQWLRNDLAAHPNTCTAAYFHHPRFSSGEEHGNAPAMGPFWEALYDRGADVVLSGHDHDYERFAPQDPSGQADSSHGIREFVVGTGGAPTREFGTIMANSQVRITDTNGVLKLTLHPKGYDWQFVTAPNGTVADSGSDSCHSPEPTEPDAVAPTISGVAPGEGATGAGVKANVEVQFSEGIDPSTVTSSTFALREGGTDARVSAAVRYDQASKKAVLNPDGDLDFGATYTATVEGGNEGVKDLAGNPLAADKVWSFTTALTSTLECTITGTSSSETLIGTLGDDVICAGGGDDFIHGYEGTDILKGEEGADTLVGGFGDDTLYGGGGPDTLRGRPGPDKLDGGEGNDSLNGRSGDDKVEGGGGNDQLFGDSGDDAVNSRDGVSGNDSLDGGLHLLGDTMVTDAFEESIIGFP